MGRIPEYTIEQIKGSIDIVELVSRYFPVDRSGFAQCPFHAEETGSFHVDRNRQIFKCFGCGKSGNVFIFLMEYHRIEFPEAVRMLASETGIFIPEDESPIRTRQKSDMHTVIAEAMRAYQDYFHNSESQEADNARRYMQQRGFTNETLLEYKIGYAPNTWDFLSIRLKRYGLELLEKAGLLSETRDKTRYFDYFRNRILFPIFDLFGKTVGFGGRTLDPDEKAKYLNTREIPGIFEKRKLLYLLDAAQDEARKEGFLIAVEGYTDALMAHQHKIKNTFAIAGTSFTKHHALMLKKLTDTVLICLDPDPAGRKRTISAAMEMLNADITVKVIPLPEGRDPDEVILEEKENFRSRIEAAQPLFEFTLEEVIREQGIASAQDNALVLKKIAPVLRAAPDAITCRTYLHAAAKRLDIPFELAADACDIAKGQARPIAITPFPTTEHEYRIAGILLRKPAHRNELALSLLPEHFKNNEIRALFSYFREVQDAKGDIITAEHTLSRTPTLFDAQYTENLPQEVLNFAQAAGLPADEGKIYKLISELQITPASELPVSLLANNLLREHYKYELTLMEKQIEDASIRKDQEALERLMQHYQGTLHAFQSLSLSSAD